MKENKNIDRLFQEKFRDFEQTPPPALWGLIEQNLDGKSKKKRAIWFWIGGIAAGLALLFVLNTSNFETKTTPIITDTNEIPIPQSKIHNTEEVVNTEKPELNSTITKQQLISTSTLPKRETTQLQNTSCSHPNSDTHFASQDFNLAKSISQNIVTAQYQSERQDNEGLQEMKKTHIDLPVLKANQDEMPVSSMENQINTTNQITITEEQTKEELSPNTELAQNNTEINDIDVILHENKWSVSSVAAPVYLDFTDHEQSTIHEGFAKNIKQGLFSKAYGVQVAYQVSKRFSVQSGVHIVDYGYRTHDVYVSPTGTINRMSNIEYESGTDLMSVQPAPDPSPSSSHSDIYQPFSMGEKGNLTQTFGYVEFPLEAKFRVIDGDFGLSAVGGFSTLVLNKNDIYIETETFSNRIGSATNMNELNFSGNFGVELDYKLFTNLRFNVSPMLKMQTHTFQLGNSKQTNPYSVGVYSGLNFWF